MRTTVSMPTPSKTQRETPRRGYLRDHPWLQAVRTEKTRWLTAFLGFLLVMDSSDMSWWPVSVPPAQFALAGLALLVALSVTVPARGTWGLTCALVVLLSVVGVSTLSTGNVVLSRLGTIVSWVFLMYGVARGALSVGSLIRGMAWGLVAGVLYGVAFLGSSSYQGRLTGLLGDPNTAGLALASVGVLTLVFLRRSWTRCVVLLIVIAGLVLTASRTSMLACVVAVVIVLLAHKTHPVVMVAGVGAIMWWLSETTRSGGSGESFFERGYFADREGSDHLRTILAPLEEQKRISGGLLGHGPGEAHIMVEADFRMFAHNSYSGFQMEFGQLGLAALALVGLVLLWRYSRRGVYRDPLMSWPVAAVSAVLIASMSLGEAIVTPAGAVAAGALVLVSRHAKVPVR